MKYFQLAAIVGVLILGGCANPHMQENTASASGSVSASEEREVPLGSLIAKKGNARDAGDKVDMQSLENDRAMNNNGLSIRQ